MRRQVNRSVVTDTAFLFLVRPALIRPIQGQPESADENRQKVENGRVLQ